MRKLFTAMFAVFAMTFILSIQPSNAAIGNCNISQAGLTKDQHQILILQCQAMKANTATGPTVQKVTEATPEDIKEWAGVAKGFAEGSRWLFPELPAGATPSPSGPRGLVPSRHLPGGPG